MQSMDDITFMKQSLSQSKIWLIFFLGAIITVVGVSLLFPHPSFLIISVLWISAISTIILPIKIQLFVLWIFLPFVDLMKRMIYIDPNANSTQMYLVLITQDIILVTIVFKLFLLLSQKTRRFHLSKTDLGVILFGGYSIFSSLTTPHVPITAKLVTIGMWIWPMIAYFLFALYFNNSSSLNKLSKVIIALGLIVAIYGIHQFFFGFYSFELAWYQKAVNSTNVSSLQAYYAERGVLRTFSTLDSHSSYGVFLGMALVLMWAFIPRLGKVPSILLSIILSFGLILSFTRFTWVMPIIAAGFIIIFNYSRIRPFINLSKLRRASMLLLGIFGAGLVFYVLMQALYGYQIINTSNPYLQRAFGTGTLEARLRFGYLIENKAFFNPIGTGLTNSSYYASKFNFSTNDINYHNMILDMLASMGLIGVTLFLVFLYYFFKSSISNLILEENPSKRRLFIALFSTVLAMLVVGHLNGAVFYYGRAIPIYFWGICGILVHYQSN